MHTAPGESLAHRWSPALLAAVVGAWGITRPSLWRDESVSGMAARLPWTDLRRLLTDIDAVHALYYLILRPFAALGDPPELWLRLPSLLAFIATAYGIAALGRRLAGPAAGLCAGVVYTLLPIAARYGQEARGYALVSAVAVGATWLLVDALERPGRWRWAAYAAAVAVLGWLHLYALLLLAAHIVAVVSAGRRHLLPWAASAAAAVILIAPLAVIAAGQREAQLFWIKPPGPADLAEFPAEAAGGAVVVFGLAALGAWSARRVPLVAAWLLVPFALSFTISQWHPIYHPRYVLFVVPGIALAAGIGTAHLADRFHRALAGAVCVLLAALALSTQIAIREPSSRPDDLRALAAGLTAGERPGDRVLFVPQRFRLFVAVYGRPYENLIDLTREQGSATPRTAAQLSAALKDAGRVWLISPRISGRYADDERLRALGEEFIPGTSRTFGTIHLTLYERAPPSDGPVRAVRCGSSGTCPRSRGSD